MKRDIESSIDSRFAFRFSEFEFVDTSEIGLSRLIGWLLNPKGSHGQRDAFLGEFLNLLKTNGANIDLDNLALGKARIDLEPVMSSGRDRLDILVHLGEIRIVIENKPYAAEQKAQLHRYSQASKPFALVYLTNDGRESLTAGEFSGYQRWSYSKDFILWLKACLAKSGAERIQTFLQAFRRFCEMRFGGMTDDTAEIATWISKLNSSVEIAAAFELGKAFEATQREFLSRLQNQIEALNVPAELNPFCRTVELEIGREKQKMKVFGFQLTGDNLVFGLFVVDSWLGIGLTWTSNEAWLGNQERSRIAALRWVRTMESNVQDDRTLKFHPSFRYPPWGKFNFPRDWKSSPEFWQAIADHSLCDAIAERAKELIALDRLDGSS